MITENISIISLLAWLVGPLARWVARRGEAAEARLAAAVARDLEPEAEGRSSSSGPPSYSALVIKKTRIFHPPPPNIPLYPNRHIG